MKLLHLSDLHIGKRVNEYSMLKDQRHILEQILNIADEEEPDAVLIAGDVYDKSMPGGDAVLLFDWFLTGLSDRKIPVLLISGNHDSPERLSFARKLLWESRIHISEVYKGKVEKITKKDEYGEVYFHLIPYLKPSAVRQYFPEEEITDYESAMEVVLKNLDLNPAKRNVLLVHQFLTGADRSDSEEISVGGLDDISAGLFDGADYVALGHLHRPQKVLRETMRYAGSPLKYSFSEADHKKSVTLVELKEKGKVIVKTRDLVPLRDMRKIKGSYLELTQKENYENTNVEDYLSITLTDEEEIPAVLGKLSAIYPNIMKLEYDNKRSRAMGIDHVERRVEQKSPLALFSEFYEMQNNSQLSEEQKDYLLELMEDIWEDVQ